MNALKEYFIAGFGAMAGVFMFMTILSVYTLIIGGSGYYLLKKYNKINEDGKQSPLFQELTPYQYVGLLLIVFGIAPFLQHFISSIFLGAGLEVGQNLVEQFTE
tara:strand:+ start:11957 stop:12268 length:312 start_codon:yes stop_codon:yes gene_type:complete